MPASSGYIALKMDAAGSLKILKCVGQAIWHDTLKDGNLQMQCKLHHHDVAIVDSVYMLYPISFVVLYLPKTGYIFNSFAMCVYFMICPTVS